MSKKTNNATTDDTESALGAGKEAPGSTAKNHFWKKDWEGVDLESGVIGVGC